MGGGGGGTGDKLGVGLLTLSNAIMSIRCISHNLIYMYM